MKNIAAIILAAGLSTRMGQPKMLLPWGETTVLGQVIAILANTLKTDARTDWLADTCPTVTPRTSRGRCAGKRIVVITGGARNIVEAEVVRLAERFPVQCVHNPMYASGEMLSSLQCGLAVLDPKVDATLIALGDQPQLSLDSARKVVAAFESTGAHLIVPSYNRRRGHPWLVQRDLWNELLSLKEPETLRDFLNPHANEILYVEADPTILKDLDTPDDYQREKP